MNVKDIIVGRKYRNTIWPDAVYLGVGLVDRNVSKARNKALVIVLDPTYNNVGYMVHADKDGSMNGYFEVP